jgi:hypothetical protein
VIQPPAISPPAEAATPAAINFPDPPDSGQRYPWGEKTSRPAPFGNGSVPSGASEPQPSSSGTRSDELARHVDQDNSLPATTDQAKTAINDIEGPGAARAADVAPEKAWLPLMLAVCALFVSIGGNVYLGWVAWDARQAYHALLDSNQVPQAMDMPAL